MSASWANVMWLFLTGTGTITVSELNDLADACSAAFADNFLPILSNQVTLDSTQIVLYDSGDAIEGLAGAGGTGGHSGTNQTPANVACVVSWQIASVYRGGHPRTYLCGVPDNSFDDTRSYTTSFKNAAESAAIAFHGDLEAISGISSGITSVEHGVVSFVHAGAWRTPPIFRRINTAHVDQRVDTQRRRLGPDLT
jgi:hypothetical protein